MLDFGRKWTPAQFEVATELGGIAAETVPGLCIAMISGNVVAGLAALGIDGPPLGAGTIARGRAFALAAARDRCLALSPGALACDEGWHGEGFAVTDVSGGFTALSLSGAGLPRLLARASGVEWRAQNRSAAVSFAGFPAMAVFHEREDCLWLIAETPLLPALLRWLAAATADW